MTELARSAEQLRGGRCLVVGDVMLDEYVFGRVSRVSPEAPIPVVHVDEEMYVRNQVYFRAQTVAIEQVCELPRLFVGIIDAVSITYSKVNRSPGFRLFSNSLQALSNSSSGHFLLIGINSLRSSSVGAAKEIARCGRAAIVANSRMRGTTPAVEIVTRFGTINSPFGSAMMPSAFISSSKFRNGSPAPMPTRFMPRGGFTPTP